MSRHKNQEGFSYIDVLIAITILMVGVLALVAAVTASVINSRAGEQQLLAKQHAASTLEAIFSARDIGNLGWEAIGNEGSGAGVFWTGRQRIMPDDGNDNVPATDDDAGTAIPGFDRQITITDICDPERPSANCSPAGTYPVMMRKVDIIIWYQVNGGWRDEKTSTIITNSLLDNN